MPLATAEDPWPAGYLHTCPRGPERCGRCAAMLASPAEWPARLHWQGPTPIEPRRPRSFEHHAGSLRGRSGAAVTMGVALDVAPAVVIVNDGRWIVCCPTDGCPEAQLASRGDRRYFCTTCLNAEVGGHWRQVWWPDDAEVAEVEQILSDRPSVKDRQWWPSDGKGGPHPLFAGQLRRMQLPRQGLLEHSGEG